MRVNLYLRVSTSSQTVENQERELAVLAAARGWTVVERIETRPYPAPRAAIDVPASTACGRTLLAGLSISSRHGASTGLAGPSPTWRVHGRPESLWRRLVP